MNVTKTYATVWEIKQNEKSVSGKISTSRKDQNGEYKNSNWFVQFVGKATEKAKTLQTRDKIIITNGRVTSEPYERDGQKTYPTRVTIFDFEMNEPSGTPEGFEQADQNQDLPF